MLDVWRVADVCMMGPEYTFNSNDGYFEGLARGFRAGILTREDYTNLCQCETLEGSFHFSQHSCASPTSDVLFRLVFPLLDPLM
jgi:hypothetical protein